MSIYSTMFFKCVSTIERYLRRVNIKKMFLYHETKLKALYLLIRCFAVTRCFVY